MSLGKTLDSAVIERGLIELNPDLHFDPATKKGAWHPHQATRQGVFYHGQHVCSMDRGIVPEFKQWSVVTKMVEVPWTDADKEDVSIQSRTIPVGDPDYVDAMLHCLAKDEGWQFRPDSSIVKLTPVAFRRMQGRVIQVGWRHTFARILYRNLPNLTTRTIGEKFSVDLLKWPVGAPHELHAAFVEE